MAKQDLIVLGTFNEIDIKARPTDQYVDVTAMCKANGKEWSSYARLASAKRFHDELSRSLQKVQGPPVKVQGPLIMQVDGGPNEERGTYAHRRIALHCAAWISAEFEQWVYEKIEELATRGRVEFFVSPTPLQALRQTLEAMELQERRMATVEARVDEIVAVRDRATAELRHVERADQPAPPLTTRDRVNRLVRAFCKANGADHSDTWTRLYRELFYRCDFNAQVRARNSGRRALDEVDAAGLMPDLFAVASEVLVF